MARRRIGNMHGERFLGNTHHKEVHDLDNEDPTAAGCQIDKIIAAHHDRPFELLHDAYAAGYDDCGKCLTGSTR